MRTTVGVLLAIVVVLLLLPGVLGTGFGMHGPGMMGWGMMGGPWGGPGRGPGPWMYGGWGGTWFWLFTIGRALLFAALIWLGYLAITRLGRPGADDRPLLILRERFARGEITREQYEEMRRALA